MYCLHFNRAIRLIGQNGLQIIFLLSGKDILTISFFAYDTRQVRVNQYFRTNLNRWSVGVIQRILPTKENKKINLKNKGKIRFQQ